MSEKITNTSELRKALIAVLENYTENTGQVVCSMPLKVIEFRIGQDKRAINPIFSIGNFEIY